MSDFKSRLIDEISQLREKIEKLDQFIESENFAQVGELQEGLLRVQLAAMRTYLVCLVSRFNALS